MDVTEAVNRYVIAKENLNVVLKKYFPKGKTIYFKKGNMTDYAPGEIKHVDVCDGFPRILVENIWTEKTRRVSLHELHESCRNGAFKEKERKHGR